MDWVSAISEALSGSSIGMFILGVLILVFGSSSVLSERAVKEKFGAFGLIARAFHKRKEQRAEYEQFLIDRRTGDFYAEIERLDREREKYQKRIVQLETIESDQYEYILWVTALIRSWETQLATDGCISPTPEFKTYSEWLKGGELAE